MVRIEVADVTEGEGALPLDAVGEVPWWPEGARTITLHQSLVHVMVDISRHAGHADILRELIDGAVGADRRWSNLPPGDEAWWTTYRSKVEVAAVEASIVGPHLVAPDPDHARHALDLRRGRPIGGP